MAFRCVSFAVVVLAALPLLPVEGHAQVVRVRVEDARTGAGIQGAVVELLGTDGERFDVGVTDSVGVVPLSVPAPGRYQLRAAHAEYGTTLSDHLTFAEGEWQDVRLYLGIESYRLAPIEVVGTSRREGLTKGQEWFLKHQRESRGGRFITAEEIRAKGARVPSEAFRAEPGFMPDVALMGNQLVPTFKATRGYGCVYVYVNLLRGGGTPNFAGQGIGGLYPEQGVHDIDTYLDVELIEGIEFYRSFDEVPREWVHYAWPPTDAGNMRPFPCALVVIWTRAAW